MKRNFVHYIKIGKFVLIQILIIIESNFIKFITHILDPKLELISINFT